MEHTEFNPTKIDQQLQSQKSAEAFAQMADDLMREQPRMEQEALDKMPTIPNSQTAQVQPQPTPQPQVPPQKPINIGPKYLEALEQVSLAADIRSIEVELPILRTKVEITPLSSKEEQAIRTASVSPESFLRKLDEILFNHIIFKENIPRTYQDFLKSLFQPDKAVLIWALLNSTYLVLPTLEKKCEQCGSQYPVEATPGELMQPDTFEKIWDKSEPATEYKEEQLIEMARGYLIFEIGMPSEFEKLALLSIMHPQEAKNNIEATGEILSPADNIIFFTKSITFVDELGNKIILTDLIQDIYPFLKNLHPKVMDTIVSKLKLDLFNDYMPNLYLNTTCPKCGHNDKSFIDPEITFFRKTISL